MNDNVVKLAEIRPKQIKESYKRIPIQLTFLPKQKKWRWSIKIISETTYSEDVNTDNSAVALRAAKKYIDKNHVGKDE